jgi:uncharacterized protein (UPF0333 family)
MFIKKKKGQSTVEYIILITAVITVMILFMLGDGAIFRSKVNQTLDAGTNGMLNMAQRVTGVFTPSPTN